MPWALILANLPGIIAAGENIIAYVVKIRAAAKQAGEWTEDHEAQFLSLLDAAKSAQHWQPDPKR